MNVFHLGPDGEHRPCPPAPLLEHLLWFNWLFAVGQYPGSL